MKRKLKTVAAVALATMASMAFSATSASAAGEVFHSEVGHTILLGVQSGEHTFTFEAGKVKCKQASLGGTQSSLTPSTQNVVAAYGECTAFGFVNTKIDLNGCEYRLEANGAVASTMAIVCPAGKVIAITAFNCEVTIGPQEGVWNVFFVNEGGGSTRDMRVVFELLGLKYTQHSKSFPGCTSGTFTTGTYTGAITLRGTNTEGSQVGIWHQ